MIETETKLADLYEADETAWLDAMADRIRRRAYDELDYAHLAEYLTDMAKRERREVKSRLVVLITHILKWVYQPDHRSSSWRGTIISQRQVKESCGTMPSPFLLVRTRMPWNERQPKPTCR